MLASVGPGGPCGKVGCVLLSCPVWRGGTRLRREANALLQTFGAGSVPQRWSKVIRSPLRIADHRCLGGGERQLWVELRRCPCWRHSLPPAA
jgi:hypothetical protein